MEDTRTFSTGATRGDDSGKLDFEGFLSPVVLERFAEYMHEMRLKDIPAGKAIRESDNWQKGMPFVTYMKSMLRHVFHVWRLHRAGARDGKELQDALCAVFFNVQGYLHESLRPTDLQN